MIQVQAPILILFIVSNLVWLVNSFIKKTWKEDLAFSFSVESWKTFFRTALAFTALFVIGSLFSFFKINSYLYFLASFGFSWLISQTSINSSAKGSVNLLVNYLFSTTHNLDGESFAPLIAQILGLIVCKVTEVLTHENKDWMDSLPALTWLTAVYWLNLSYSDINIQTSYSFLLAALSINNFVNFLLQVFSQLSKNIIIQSLFQLTVAGLSAFIFAENILLTHKLISLVIIYTVGFLLANILQFVNKKQNDNDEKEPTQGLIQLAIIGLGALIASRISGTIGWLVLAIPFIQFSKIKVLQVASLFFVVRALLQGFIIQYNPNVSGINLVHPYVSAALFGGIVIAFTFPVYLQYKSFNKYLFISKSISLALLSAFFLHEEATGSFLVALSTTSLCVCLIGYSLYKEKDNLVQENILWLPALIITITLLASNILDSGNTANKLTKFAVLLVVLILTALSWFIYENILLKRQLIKVSRN